MALLRALYWLLKISLIAGAVILFVLWLYQQNGFITIQASGYDMRFPLGIGVLGFVVLVAALMILWRIIRAILFAPKAMQDFIQERQRAKGYRALSMGFMAITAEDEKRALKASKQANLLLADKSHDQSAMVLLLQAQSMQLAGKHDAAQKLFETMVEQKETRFLGLRGLAHLAMQKGDQKTAMLYVRQAREIMPQSKWAVETLYRLSEEQGDLIAAQEIMHDSVMVKSMTKQEQQAQEAKLWLMRARDAQSQGLLARALSHIKKAWKHEPSLDIAKFYGEILLEQNKKRQGRNLLQEAWVKMPDLSLVDLYMDLADAKSPLEQLKAAEILTKNNANVPESRILLAHTALNAELWGETERYLDGTAIPEHLQHHVDEIRQKLKAQSITAIAKPI